jgi:quinolinate synthase
LHVIERDGDAEVGVSRGEKICFLPDQHLGRNTRYKMGIPLDEMVCGIQRDSSAASIPSRCSARDDPVEGHCSVHTRFTATQIEAFAASTRRPRDRASRGAVGRASQAADDSGSTEYIIKTVTNSPEGSVWAVGLPRCISSIASHSSWRLDRTVISLDQFGCLCSTMFRVSPNHLLWILEELVEAACTTGSSVPDDQKHWNRVALDRMLSIS